MSDWRYRCPKGHTTYHRRVNGMKEASGEYYCESCDAYFSELIDMKDPADHHVADPEVTAV
jgi:predicted SprT family Zn-dependent metalloprotease